MRIAILKIVVVLLAAGSGEARPQRIGKGVSSSATLSTESDGGWKPIASTESSQITQGDSRYRHSESSNKPYARYYRGPIIPIGSNAIFQSPVARERGSNVFPPTRRNAAKVTGGESGLSGVPGRNRVTDVGLTLHREPQFDGKFGQGPEGPGHPGRHASKSSSLKVKPGSAFDFDGFESTRARQTVAVPEEKSGTPVNRRSPLTRSIGAAPPPRSTPPRNWNPHSVSGWTSKRFEAGHGESRQSVAIPLHVVVPEDKGRENAETSGSKMEFASRSRTPTPTRFIPISPVSFADRTDQSEYARSKVVVPLELKNWPNDAVQDIRDLYNYEKYTSLEDQGEGGQVDERKNASASPQVTQKPFREPSMEASVQEIIHWLKIPAFTHNGSHVIDEDSPGPVSNTFGPIYNDLEPNNPMFEPDPGDKWTIVKPPDVPIAENASFAWTLDPGTRPTFNPLTQVQQNTVVHILNNAGKKPNVTVSEPKLPAEKPVVVNGSSSEVVARPNVHIMFMSQDNEVKDEGGKDSLDPEAALADGCPTILINQFTRINNTIQSKEGCTDLNIVINSHILSTSVLKPASASASASSPLAGDPEVPQDNRDPEPNDKYLGDPSQDPFTSGTSYISESTAGYESAGTSGSQYGDRDPLEDAGEGAGVPQEDGVAQVSTVEVFQGTQISLGQSAADGGGVEEVVQQDPISAGNDVPEDSPVGDSGASSPGVPVGQSNDAISSVNLPSSLTSGANLPGLPSLPATPVEGTGNTAVTTVGAGDDDDDDDDDYDFSPDGIFESATSAFTYFTFLNPLHYGFFSLAAAPFAAMAAGVLGVAAFLFPWAFPGVFDLGRSSNRVNIRFKPSLDEVVRRSVHKYERLNDWKGKRRKKKR